MSTIRFFTAALSILASATTLVNAAPTVISRAAAKKAVPYFSPKSFTSTGWGGSNNHANSGLRVYFPVNGGIQELIANNGGLAAHDQKWTNGTFLHDDTFEVEDTAAISAVNTYKFGQDEIDIVFISKDMNLRSWEYSGGSWRKGSLVSSTPDFKGTISANSYKDPKGVITISAFYSHGDGWVEELQKQNGGWSYLDQIGKINDGVAFTTIVETISKITSKRVFTADNLMIKWLSNAPQWTSTVGKTAFNSASIAAAALGANNLRFYAAHGAPNPSVTQWSMNQGNFNSPNGPKVVAQQVLTTGSPVSVSTQKNTNGLTWVYVFYLGPGAHLRCAMYDGKQWYVDDERVEV